MGPWTVAICLSNVRDPHDVSAERLHPSAQLRVGGVDQRRRPVRVFVYQFHDSVIRSIPAAMSGVDHG